MAEIKIQEKKSSIWPWVIGLIVLLLLIWGATELMEDDRAEAYTPPAAVIDPATDPVERTPVADEAPVAIAATPQQPAVTDNTPIQVATIVAGATSFYGQPVVGTAMVTNVPTDRGFWLEQDGSRLFALIAKSPDMEDAINVNAGQQLRLSGVVYPTSMVGQIDGELDTATRQLLAGQKAFLLVNATNIAIVNR